MTAVETLTCERCGAPATLLDYHHQQVLCGPCCCRWCADSGGDPFGDDGCAFCAEFVTNLPHHLPAWVDPS